MKKIENKKFAKHLFRSGLSLFLAALILLMDIMPAAAETVDDSVTVFSENADELEEEAEEFLEEAETLTENAEVLTKEAEVLAEDAEKLSENAEEPAEYAVELSENAEDRTDDTVELLEAKGYDGKIDLSRWMSYLDDNWPITELNIPGSHDSESVYVVLSPLAKTQNRLSSTQVYWGARVFDLRYQYLTRHKQLTGVHGDIPLYKREQWGIISKFVGALYAIRFAPDYLVNAGWTLNGFVEFLDKNPTETIICLYNQDGKMWNGSDKDVRDAMKKWINEHQDISYELAIGDPIPTLGQVRGKIVFADMTDSNKRAVNKAVDKYNKGAVVKSRELEEWFGKTRRQNVETFDRLGNNGTADVVFTSCIDRIPDPFLTAGFLNPLLISMMGNKSNQFQKNGWILGDFIDEKYCESVIRTNDFTQYSKEPHIFWTVDEENKALILSSNKSTNGQRLFVCKENRDKFPWKSYWHTIEKVVIQDRIEAPSYKDWFSYLDNLREVVNAQNLSTDLVRDTSDMFEGCKKLEILDTSSWTLKNAEDCSSMFKGCEMLKTLDTSSWTLNKAANISSMFAGCEKLKTLDTSSWTLNQVENISNMFAGCRNLDRIDLSNVQSKSLTNMKDAFKDCTETQLKLAGLDVSHVKDMSELFKGLKVPDLRSWDVSGCTNMQEMFANSKPESPNVLETWNTRNVKDMTGMFWRAEVPDIRNWDVSNVTSMSKMFKGATLTDPGMLKTWNVSGVTDMTRMFEESAVTGLENWNMSGSKDLTGMFDGAQISEPEMFKNWGVTGNVTAMFRRAEFAKDPDFTGWNWTVSSLKEFLMYSSIHKADFTGWEGINDLTRTFYGCSNLTEVKLPKFLSGKAVWVTEAFEGGNVLEKIYADELYFISDPQIYQNHAFGEKYRTGDTFQRNWKLKGEKNTRFSQGRTNYTMFWIDGLYGRKGYLTAIREEVPVKVTDEHVVYDGKEHSIHVVNENPAEYQLVYLDENGKESGVPPVYTDATGGAKKTTIKVFKNGKLVTVKEATVTIDRKDITAEDAAKSLKPAQGYEDHPLENGRFLNIYSETEGYKVTAEVTYNGMVLAENKDFTISGRNEVTPQMRGCYPVYVYGKGNYTGKVKFEWEIRSDSDEIRSDSYYCAYDTLSHGPVISLGGAYDNLERVWYFSTDNGTTWTKEYPKFTNAGDHSCLYWVKGYRAVYGAALSTPSTPGQKLEGTEQEETKKEEAELLGEHYELVLQTKGSAYVGILPGALVVTPVSRTILPGVPVGIYGQVAGSELGKNMVFTATAGGKSIRLNSNESRIILDNSGVYPIEITPASTETERAKNFVIQCEQASITVLDVEKELTGSYQNEGASEGFVLSVQGADSSSDLLNYKWEEKISGEWVQTGENKPELVLKAVLENEGRVFRCRISTKDSYGELITGEAALRLIRNIDKNEVTVSGTEVLYDGTEHSIRVDLSGKAAGGKVYYREEGKEEYSGQPVTRKEPGSKTIEFIVAADNCMPYEGKAQLTVLPGDGEKAGLGVWLKSGSELVKEKEMIYDEQAHPVLTGTEAELVVKVPENAGEYKVLFGYSEDACNMETFPTQKNVRYDENGKIIGNTVYYCISSENYEDVTGKLTYTLKPRDISKYPFWLEPGNQVAYEKDSYGYVSPVYGGCPIGADTEGICVDGDVSVLYATEVGTYPVLIRGYGNYTGQQELKWTITTDLPLVDVKNVQVRYEEGSGKKYHAEVIVTEPKNCKITYIRQGQTDGPDAFKTEESDKPFEYSEPGTYMDYFVVKDTSAEPQYEDYYGMTIVSIGNIDAGDRTVEYDGYPHSVEVAVSGMNFIMEEGSSGYTILYSEDGKTYSEKNPSYTEAGRYTVYYRVAMLGSEENIDGSAALEITPAKIGEGDIQLSPSGVFGFDGKAHTVKVLVKGKLLELAKDDFELDSSSDALTQTKAGTYRVKVNGRGNYQGTATASWQIRAGKLPPVRSKDYFGYYDNKKHAASLEIPEELTGAKITYYAEEEDLAGRKNGKDSPIAYEDAGTWFSYYLVEKDGYESQTGIMAVSLAGVDIVGWEGTYDGLDHSITVSLSEELEDLAEVYYSESAAGPGSRKKPAYTGVNEAQGGKRVYVSVNSPVYGTYTGNASVVIRPVSFREGEIQIYPQSTFAYDGKEKAVELKYQGKPLPEGMQVTGTQKAAAVGSYQVTVTGTGTYQGTVSLSWKISDKPLMKVETEDYKGIYDGRAHSAKVVVPGDQTEVKIKYSHYEADQNGEYSLIESEEPFEYSQPGWYFDNVEVSRPGYETYTGVVSVQILAGELKVKVRSEDKIAGQDDPAFTYEVQGIGNEFIRLHGIVFEREAGELPGDYKVTAREEIEGINELYMLNFESGTLHIMDVDYKATPGSITVENGKTAVFSVSGKEEDLQNCLFMWEIKAPGTDEWVDVEDTDYESTLKIPDAALSMSGSMIRCLILVNNTPESDVYSKEAKLTVYRPYGEETETGSELSGKPVKTGTWGDPVIGGTWILGSDGKWMYKTNAYFRSTWGYIRNPYAKEGQQKDAWFYFDANGKMLTGWQWIKGSDGLCRCYWLNPVSDGTLGMCFLDTTTPDGYTVSSTGAWTHQGKEVTKAEL